AVATLPEATFDWHVRELPAVCREGRHLSPAVAFHDSDDCVDRCYDLVIASSSLQYVEPWREYLNRLAQAARRHLFVTRLPIVQTPPSFVALQRAQPYGYATEYLGWVLNRCEFLDAASHAGLTLEREFHLQDPYEILGAPEHPTEAAFLFTPT